MNKPARFPNSLELVPVGTAVGVVLPAELLERMGLTLGDRLQLAETEAGFAAEREVGGYSEQMAAARTIMHERRRALAELAK